ncbi:MAG: hypothetical protein ACRYG7_17295 [Janthinobacterium lividum]
MQLAFVWIEHHLGFENLCVVFDRQRQYTVTRPAERRFLVAITERENFIPDFFGSAIANVTSIVGENGAGKTNLLKYIRHLLTKEAIVGDRFILGMLEDTGQLHLYHTLYDIPNSLQENRRTVRSWQLNTSGGGQVKKTPLRVWANVHGHFRVPGIAALQNTETIYYSPIVDLRNYPPAFSEPAYTDISTNFLLYADAQGSDGENVDAVERHRLENVRRQLAYLTRGLLGHPRTFAPPTQVAVSCVGITSLAESITRDLSYKTREMYNMLDKYIMERYHEVNTKTKKGQSIGAKYWFIQQLLTNFFRNLATAHDYRNSFVQVDTAYWAEYLLGRPDPFRLLDAFLQQQKRFKTEAARALLKFVQALEGNLDELLAGFVDENTFNLTLAQAAELLILYTHYLEEFPTEGVIGFLAFNWRDLSSGEKLQLDLYSRLLTAKDVIVRRRAKEQKTAPVSTIFLLLDEGEIGWHPRWQRQYLKSLLDFLGNWIVGGGFELDIRVQVVLTSHSPFLLSDLPRECVVLLQKIESQVQVVELPGAERTLGANIHDLLANAFFLGDSLVGDFAAHKINEVIQQLTDTNTQLTVERVAVLSHVIELIAEPLVREKLQQMLVEKLLAEGNREVLNAEARRLEALANRLRGNQ